MNWIKWIVRNGSVVSMYTMGLLAMLIGIDTFLRYGFSFTKNWIIELETYLFSLIFLFGIAYALEKEQHVRIDIFYRKFSRRIQEWMDLAGHLLFLVPWCLVLLATASKYVRNSYLILEKSPNPGGLPFRFILKSLILLCFSLLLLQGLALITKGIRPFFQTQKPEAS
jgi:TRAP-type mannitol/chloroaromatic compound transport system permease small subunit